MEEELKCAYCKNFYCNPVLLPCSHSLCYACALDLQEKFNSNNNSNSQSNTNTIKSTYSIQPQQQQNQSSTANSLMTNTMKLNRILSNKQLMNSSSSSATSPSAISPQSSISSSSSINIADQMCLNGLDFGASIISDLDKLSVFSEADSGNMSQATTNTSSSPTSSSSSNNSTVTTSSSSSSNSSACSSNNCSRPCSYLSNSSLSTTTTTTSTTTATKQQNHHITMMNNKNTTVMASSASLLPIIPPPVFPSATPLYSVYLPCPHCNRMIYMDETGVNSLVKNTCLENIVERYTESKKVNIKCQMCPPIALMKSNDENGEKHEENDAVVMCEQCEICYCEQCREACHPMRGPLQKHSLVPVKLGRDLIKRKNRSKEAKCADHPNEMVALYCLVCKCSCCNICVTESVHLNHEMQHINSYSKSQKAELSRILQSLSAKAKSTTEFVSRLKTLPELIEDNSVQVKEILLNELDDMIRLIDMKKKELTDFLDIEKTSKIKSIKEQIINFSTRIQKTTGLLQFCVETLKEPDPTSFLQISEHMIRKMSDIENKFPTEQDLQPKCDLDFDFVLNNDTLMNEIKKLNLKQIKVPVAPGFVAEGCITDLNETIILSWNNNQKHQTSTTTIQGLKQKQQQQQINICSSNTNVQGYILEIDDGGISGQFKEVYCGPNTICQVNGLCPNSIYNARVKAFNQAGCSEYSPIISMPSSPSLWFALNPKTSHPDAVFSNNFTSASCVSFEDRTILGSIGFSKGVHYWEITIDRYDNQPDPAFGVARYDVSRDHMLGKCSKSWCMYIDSKRSWFMHNGKHLNRVDNGIQQACVVGVLLNLNNNTLSFFVNDEPHGGTAFSKLPNGVYYPAFSLNKNVQITVNSGLEPPPCLDNSDCD